MALHKAVVEIIEVVSLSCKEGNLKVSIKTTGDIEEGDDTLFHIKVCTDSHVMSEVDFRNCQELFTLVQRMQCAESESHLCVQYRDPKQNDTVLQRSYHASPSDKSLNFFNTCKITSSTVTGISVHLRVFHPEYVVMQECQKVYRYLHQHKMYKPQRQIEISLKVHDNRCIWDLRDTAYRSVKTDRVRSTVSDEMQLYSAEVPYNVKLTTVVIRFSVSGPLSTQQGPLYGGTLVMLCLYGPMSLPVPSGSRGNLLENLPWESHGLQLFPSELLKNFIELFWFNSYTLLRPANNESSQKNSSIVHIHLHLNTEENSRLGLLKWLLNNFTKLLKIFRQEMINNISDAVNKMFESNKKLQLKKDAYTKIIPEITKSLCTIISRSPDEVFRHQCYNMLNATDLLEAQTELDVGLRRIAKRCCGDVPVESMSNTISKYESDKTLESQQVDSFNDLEDDFFEGVDMDSSQDDKL